MILPQDVVDKMKSAGLIPEKEGIVVEIVELPPLVPFHPDSLYKQWPSGDLEADNKVVEDLATSPGHDSRYYSDDLRAAVKEYQRRHGRRA